ncbi:MAG TPA: bifunctional phosphoribosylaminoimidazolecarboxamide formyltransferase/IMP cyclohydrolase [Acidimicrobiales bacterium]|nr:bifunctional phosphoribosylaminoimidazolecarboxamide formyltransferase/IMP cyclohydrolase [Acidimicrobiales bacterium]
MRALLSVYDKTGIVDLGRGLHDLGWELVSSSNTARALREAGLPVTDVAEVTGVPEMLGHRVVTLHPNIHGGLLADLDNPSHVEDLERHDITPIGLIVSNLYPFVERPDVETIDIGGPAMVRAAAKNHAHVAVVVDPSDYGTVLDELRRDGSISSATRRALARKAFAHTSAYDAAISAWLASEGDDDVLPQVLSLTLDRVQELRYGENPHQAGARYRFRGLRSWWDDAVQHGGKELSYLNLFDAEAAWRLVHQLGDRPAAVVVKHANPCGVAVADDITSAYIAAHECDPVSAFGGIVALNRPVPDSLAQALAPVFTEVVVAPSYDDDALATLTAKKNMRVLSAPPPGARILDIRSIDNGLLVQQADSVSMDRAAWRVVTKVAPTEEQWRDLELAWIVCAAVSSNAIVLVGNERAVGIGAGQQNRVDSARIAATRAAGRAKGGACASDAYFPFRDGLDAAAEAGVAAVIQPGGSIRDEEVIAAADEHGLAMVFTGERHFRH